MKLVRLVELRTHRHAASRFLGENLGELGDTPTPLENTGFWVRSSEAICFWFLFSLGALFRIRQYLAHLSFWNDEAALALSLSIRGFAELLHPLGHGQVAPIAFCWIEKASMLLFGPGELGLRLFPLLAGIGSLPLIFLFGRRTLGTRAGLISLGLLAVNGEAIRYAAELKPYSLDLLLALAFLFLGWRSLQEELRPPDLLVLGVGGGVAVWFSFPVVFILATLGCLLALTPTSRRRGREVATLAAIGGFWILSFTLQWYFLGTNAMDAPLLEYWSPYFMPLPPTSFTDLQWFGERFLKIFRDPLAMSPRDLVAAIFLAGCLFLYRYRKKRPLLLLLLLPLSFNLLASGFKKYPFGDRLLLYAAPSFLVPIAGLVSELWSRPKPWLKMVGIAILGVTLFKPAIQASQNLVTPKKREEMRAVLASVSRRRQAVDVIFLYSPSGNTFRYYRDSLGLENTRVIESAVRSPETLDRLPEDLAKLRGLPRVWLLFGDGWKMKGVNMEATIVAAARREGRQLAEFREVGAAVYLFTFSMR